MVRVGSSGVLLDVLYPADCALGHQRPTSYMSLSSNVGAERPSLLAQTLKRPIKIAMCNLCVRMLLTQHTRSAHCNIPQESDRFVNLTGLMKRSGQVVARLERVGIIFSHDQPLMSENQPAQHD